MRPKAQLQAAVRHHIFQSRQQTIRMGLADAVRMKALQGNNPGGAGAGQQTRKNLFFQHPAQLTRDAGGEEEARLADIHGKAAGGADRVVDHLRRGRQHGLLAVVRRHHAGALGEKRLHGCQPFLIKHEIDAGGLRRDFLRQVIHRRAKPAIDDHRVGALGRQLEGRQQCLPVVTHGGAPIDRQPDILELLGHVRKVGIDDLAGEHFVAGAENLDAHFCQCPVRSTRGSDERMFRQRHPGESRDPVQPPVRCPDGPRLSPG